MTVSFSIYTSLVLFSVAVCSSSSRLEAMTITLEVKSSDTKKGQDNDRIAPDQQRPISPENEYFERRGDCLREPVSLFSVFVFSILTSDEHTITSCNS